MASHRAAPKRREWGADERVALTPMPARPSDRSLTLSRVAIVVTVLAWIGYTTTTVLSDFVSNGLQGMRFMSEAAAYLLVVTLLTFSALTYLVTRQGYLHRSRAHRRVARADLEAFFDEARPRLTVLVPSYREDGRVVRKTLLSAALQEHPNLEIVLLIDDPPVPTRRAHAEMLEAARALPHAIEALLAEPRDSCVSAFARHRQALVSKGVPDVDEMLGLADAYDASARWLRSLAEDGREVVDHADQFFVDHVLWELAKDLGGVASALRSAAREGAVLPAHRFEQLYRRLVWTFTARLSSFERKQYVSLSGEMNKAMNLNSYIGLMGGRYREVSVAGGKGLVPVGLGPADLEISNPDLVLTLDADSILLPEYALRLVYLLGQPEYERVAVVQTPYSAFPGATTRLERIAGATTDIQHIVHQGLTHFGATFWVGANAILRKRALDDICEVERVNGFEIRRYIQDRTVIEDTESSVDLALHGWELLNYPERLSYSATPPDFGSLCIQRQRWADGGLLILPKLLRNARERRRRGERVRLLSTLLRVNYLASIAWASFALVLMLVYPFSNRLLSPLVFLAALPYFVAMGRDLRACGYRRLDILRIYGFNLILLPVNLSGTIKSVWQSLSGRKIPFARTPKVRNRTTAPLSFVVFPWLIVVYSGVTFARDVPGHRWVNAVFAGLNAALGLYAIVAFVGLRNSLVDVFVNVREHLYKPERPAPVRPPEGARVEQPPEWARLLHYGSLQAHFEPAPLAQGLSGPGGRHRSSGQRASRPGASTPGEAFSTAPAAEGARSGAFPAGAALSLGEVVQSIVLASDLATAPHRAPVEVVVRTQSLSGQLAMRVGDTDVIVTVESVVEADDGEGPLLAPRHREWSDGGAGRDELGKLDGVANRSSIRDWAP